MKLKKILGWLLWPLGLSFVEEKTTPEPQTQPVAAVILTDADYADIYATYMKLRGNGYAFKGAWEAIVAAKKWDKPASEAALAGFQEYIQKNPGQVQQPESGDKSTDGSVIL